MTKVSILQCSRYDKQAIKTTILNHLKNIDFAVDQFNKKNVALKPNLLYATPPEKAIITHPVFFQAVLEIVKENGGKVYVIESPALESIHKVLRIGGYLELINSPGISLPEVNEQEVLFYEKGQTFKRFEVTKAFVDMDIIINIPKLKTHALTYITCAVKNLFGMIPGLEKPKWHQRARSKDEFARFILDFNEALLYGFKKQKVYLHLVDGVTGLEGNGPGAAGTPRDYSITIAGTNAVAVDYTAGAFLGLNNNAVRTTVYGFDRGFDGVSSPEDIKILGQDISSIKLQDVKTAESTFGTDVFNNWPLNTAFMKNIMLRWFSKKPVPDPLKCILCYKCKKICPVTAIYNVKKNKKVPYFDYSTCIRCFCCHEICPEAAITIR